MLLNTSLINCILIVLVIVLIVLRVSIFIIYKHKLRNVNQPSSADANIMNLQEVQGKSILKLI